MFKIISEKIYTTRYFSLHAQCDQRIDFILKLLFFFLKRAMCRFHSVSRLGDWELCSQLRPICFPQHEKSTSIMEQTDALKSSHFKNWSTETSY